MYSSMNIGEYVFVGENSFVQASLIGNHVYIGHNCVVVSLLNIITFSLKTFYVSADMSYD